MKRIIFGITILLCISMLTAFKSGTNTTATSVKSVWTSDFCEGWKDGYCEGWKDVKGQFAICPLTPLCPLPGIGEDSYRGGYNKGFKAGMRAAENQY